MYRHDLPATSTIIQPFSECWSCTACLENILDGSFIQKRQVKYDYVITGQVLTRTDQIRDLGVLLDSKLAFMPPMEDIIGRGNRALGLIFKFTKDFYDQLVPFGRLVSLYGDMGK
uniref:Uncharacterized protein n=1 Tax=Anopheles stephensi TaxID=30069 RepID=A0A182YIJ2_ANOST